MLYRLCRTIDIRTLSSIQHGGLHLRNLHFIPAINTKFSCLCQLNSTNKEKYTISQHTRVHSSLSNSRRQKVVLEASTPKIILGKLPVDNKELPNENSLRNKVTRVKDGVEPYIKLMRIDKPIGTWLLFWPCSWSIAMATVSTSVPLSVAVGNLGLFLAGSFIMRGAGCTINDLWDKDIDAKVERTRDRPLVSGAITQRQAIIFLAAQLSAGLAILLQLNWYSIILGASSMLLVVTYPLAKRFTNYPQLFLGATFNWGALLGWTAVQGHLEPLVCLPLYVGALCWTVVYDTIYAHQDKIDDARIGIKSTALTFGSHTKPVLTALGVVSLACLGAAGLPTMDWQYYTSLMLAGAHVGRQIYTLDPDSPTDCALKFKSNSLVGLIVFLGIVLGGMSQYRKGKTKEPGESELG